MENGELRIKNCGSKRAWVRSRRMMGMSSGRINMLTEYRNLAVVAIAVVGLTIYSSSGGSASQAGKEFMAADAKLNRVYQSLVNKIKNPVEKRQLIAAQKSWIALRDADTKFFGSYYTNSKGGLFYQTKLTNDRADYLQAILDNPPTANGDNFGPEKYTQ